MARIYFTTVLALLTGFLFAGQSLSYGIDYYVSTYWGDDTMGDGSSSNPWATIQFAIDNAEVHPPEYTNIRVDRGTYTENITLRNGIRLYGGYDSQQGWLRDLQRVETRIKAASSSMGSHTVTMAEDCRLDGFTVSDGFMGIYCNGGSPEIFNNIVESHIHYGIVVWGGATPLIQQNEIRQNRGGIYCATGSSPTIILNTITENYEQGIYCDASFPTIYRNTILHNYLSGIYCLSNSEPTIVANRIVRNLDTGVFSLHSEPIVANNFIVGNGIGLHAKSASSVTMENNTCYGNIGSAVLLDTSGGVLKNNIFSNNKGYGVEENDADSDPEVIYNCFFENETADYFDEGTSAVIGAELINALVIDQSIYQFS
ncbi:right-handed parallel beta-helix repeat-containing protein, partial [Candidatus Sumerlaeota bacterium]|nr:right-handed parallel beta-helix repeat-containing protein [Candidatus Sumerlaeota bacterium]